MKLFRKIYVQAAVGMVLLSVWLLGWLLYETQKESLQDVIQYEAAQMDLQMQRFRDAVQTKKMTGESDSRVKELWKYVHCMYRICIRSIRTAGVWIRLFRKF